MKIGVIALQGAFREHLQMIEFCGARGVGIKRPTGLNDIKGLIIPGGESTTIGMLLEQYGFIEDLVALGRGGTPIFGTCAGLILMANRVYGKKGPILGLADVLVRRNAFGRQVDSFEKDLVIEGIAGAEMPFRGVFIRAPVIDEVGERVMVMASLPQGVVMARQDNYLLSAFHPELTGDPRVHSFFIDAVRESVTRDTEV